MTRKLYLLLRRGRRQRSNRRRLRREQSDHHHDDTSSASTTSAAATTSSSTSSKAASATTRPQHKLDAAHLLDDEQKPHDHADHAELGAPGDPAGGRTRAGGSLQGRRSRSSPPQRWTADEKAQLNHLCDICRIG